MFHYNTKPVSSGNWAQAEFKSRPSISLYMNSGNRRKELMNIVRESTPQKSNKSLDFDPFRRVTDKSSAKMKKERIHMEATLN